MYHNMKSNNDSRFNINVIEINYLNQNLIYVG